MHQHRCILAIWCIFLWCSAALRCIYWWIVAKTGLWKNSKYFQMNFSFLVILKENYNGFIIFWKKIDLDNPEIGNFLIFFVELFIITSAQNTIKLYSFHRQNIFFLIIFTNMGKLIYRRMVDIKPQFSDRIPDLLIHSIKSLSIESIGVKNHTG